MNSTFWQVRLVSIRETTTILTFGFLILLPA